MSIRCLIPLFLLTAVAHAQDAKSASTADGKLRIICFGAHPDDAEYKSGGSAALWAKQGHQVKLVSVTNGDIRAMPRSLPPPAPCWAIEGPVGSIQVEREGGIPYHRRR